MPALLAVAALGIVTNLPTVVVEATRLDQTEFAAPSAIRVIGPDEIAATGSRDAVELIVKKAPEVHVRRLGGGNPALTEVSMRGYGENGYGRTLVLVDGERLNSPDMNAPNLAGVAVNGFSRLEVVAGPQTVLYGDGASAGVINVVTEPQDDERKSYAELHGGSWGTVGAALGTRGGLAEEGLRYWADGSWERSDGYREHSGYAVWNLRGGLKKTWAGGTSLRVSGSYNDARYNLPGALTYREWQDDPQQSHATEDRFHRASYGFRATFDAHLDDENAWKTTVSFAQRRLHGYQEGTGWSSDNRCDVYAVEALTEWRNTARLWGFEDEFRLGARFADDFLNGVQTYGASEQHPDYGRLAMDFYAHDTFRFTEAWALQLGGRYSRTWSRNDLCEKDRRADNLGAFEAALVFNPTDESKLYLKASRFYRNPFLDEVPGRYDAGYRWVNTEILAPETGWTTEFGATWRATEELSFGADAYFTWLEDEIFYNSLACNNENSDAPTWRRGFDAHAAWEREKVAGLSVAVSYVKATFDGGDFGGNAIPLVPEVTVAVNGRFWLWRECFVFGGYRYQCATYSASDFGNDWDEMEGYNLFHVGIAWEPTCVAWLEGVRLSFTVDNLFDENYCDYATYGSQYYPAVGRSLLLSVRYAF